MIDMPHIVSSGAVKRSANYSNCPLKKRPIKYECDDESKSDSEISVAGSSPAPIEISEPENLSTKPEDLRLTIKPHSQSVSSTGLPIHQSPPPIALVAGRGDLSSPNSNSNSSSSSYHTNGYCHQLYAGHGQVSPPYSPGSYLPLPQPPLLKFLPSSGGGGPLEPISLNPPAVWPKVSPFSAFNFANSVGRSQPTSSAHHYSHSHSRHQNHHPNELLQHQQQPQHLQVFPGNYHPNSKGSNSVIRTQPTQFHYSPGSFANCRGESGSPPHVSPPLKTEASYPLIKQEVQVHRHREGLMNTGGVPQHENTRLVSPGDFVISNIHDEKNPQIKREVVTLGNYHHSTSSRESVISHSHGHSHSHGYSSGISSPTSSTSSCSGSVSSGSGSGGNPPLTTPTNGGSVRYQCSDCSKSYSTYSGLTKHVQFHCSSQNKKSFICKFCEKVYVSLGALKMHIRTHTLPCKCKECGKAFSRPWLLQGHIRTHTGEKPFACQHCNRAFADRSNLRAHLQTHSEVKKYSCKACSKTFSRMSLLVKHEDSGCSSTLSN